MLSSQEFAESIRRVEHALPPKTIFLLLPHFPNWTTDCSMPMLCSEWGNPTRRYLVGHSLPHDLHRYSLDRAPYHRGHDRVLLKTRDAVLVHRPVCSKSAFLLFLLDPGQGVPRVLLVVD